MATLRVKPRPTRAERDDFPVLVDCDEALVVYAALLDEWVAPHKSWELELREGHDAGRPNNVEARLLLTGGTQTSSLSFRLDQLADADDTGPELLLRFEERDGIAKVAALNENGLDVELFHIPTFT
jgi:hypothetical protein